MDDCRLHQWDCTCLVSLPSKVYNRSVSGQRKVLQTEVQQFLASCGSIIHQTHKALVPNSRPLTGIRLHKQHLQPFLPQKNHNLSRSFLRRDTANISVNGRQRKILDSQICCKGTKCHQPLVACSRAVFPNHRQPIHKTLSVHLPAMQSPPASHSCAR